MKNIDIYIDAFFNKRSGINTWKYYLIYGEYVIKRVGGIRDYKGNYSYEVMILTALYKALTRVTESCNIKIHSKIEIKLDVNFYNRKLVNGILQTINKDGHSITIINNDNFIKIDAIEKLYGKRRDTNSVFNIQTVPTHVKEVKRMSREELYADLDDNTHEAWIPGSGGY